MQGTRLKLAVREAPSASDRTTRKAAKRALVDAAALLPWRGLGKPSRPRLVLHAIFGALWYLPGSAMAGALAPLGAAGLALHFGITALFVLLAPALFALLGSFAFNRLASPEGRVHQALVCPYCRDEVGQEDALICARTKCGALYHRECWDECALLYGGCAVYGCSSKRSKEVTAAGFMLRLVRLGVAAVLFPPRAVKALRNSEEETTAAVYRRSLGACRRVYRYVNRDGNRQSFFVLVLGIPLSYGVVYALFHDLIRRGMLDGARAFFAISCIFGVPFLMLVLPYLLAMPPTFLFFFAQAVKRALASEFAALERADQGGGTVLGRLAAGFGKKECC